MFIKFCDKRLIVEDDKDLRQGIALNLTREGYEVLECERGEVAIDLVAAKGPDLLILDVGLPGLKGLDVCRRLRKAGSDIPIIFLSERAREIDRVNGLETGADDYVTKPFSIRELQLRIQVQLRRRQKPKITSYQFGDVEIDFEKLRATRKGKSLDLTPREFDILRHFIQHRGEVVTREQLLEAVWKSNSSAHTVDTHIFNLRKKVEPHPKDPEFLISMHGEGYKFVG